MIPVADDEQHETTASGLPIERRRTPRRTTAAGDWESIALGRVARRLGTLSGTRSGAGRDAQSAEPDESFGWEEAALRNLRQRLKDRGPV